MKLLFQLAFLAITLFLTGLIIILKLLPPENALNQLIRPPLLHQSVIRNFLKLNQAGDNRYLYTSPQVSPITVQVINAPEALESQLNQWLGEIIQSTLNKPADISFTQQKILHQPLKDAQLQDLLTQNSSTPQSHLRLFFLTQSQDYPSHAGLVLSDDTIFIFLDTLNSLSSDPAIRSRLLESTIKHEWGHLLGLDHLDQENCIMSQMVEVYENRTYQNRNIPTDYCPETLFQINRLLQGKR